MRRKLRVKISTSCFWKSILYDYRHKVYQLTNVDEHQRQPVN